MLFIIEATFKSSEFTFCIILEYQSQILETAAFFFSQQALNPLQVGIIDLIHTQNFPKY